MSSEFRAGQSRAHLALIPSPALARPTPVQASPSLQGAQLLSAQGRALPHRSPRCVLGSAPWSLWNPHGTAEVRGGGALGVTQGIRLGSPSCVQAGVLLWLCASPSQATCWRQLLCLSVLLFWFQGGAQRGGRRHGCLARPAFSDSSRALALPPQAGSPLEVDPHGQW